MVAKELWVQQRVEESREQSFPSTRSKRVLNHLKRLPRKRMLLAFLAFLHRINQLEVNTLITA